MLSLSIFQLPDYNTVLKRIAAKFNNPDDKCVMQNGWMEKSFQDVQKAFQKYNYSKGKGELSEELQSWINREFLNYSPKLSSIMGKGTQKVQLMYYGMVYTILQNNGFFLLGKKNSPIKITRSRYCQLFKQNRKSLSSKIYSYNFYLENETDRKENESWIKTYWDFGKLKLVFDDIEKEVLKY